MTARVYAELWNRAGEASLWEICFYSNPWASLKQKQKNKNKNKELEGAVAGWAPGAISRPVRRRRCRTWRRVYPPQPISAPCQATWRATRAAQPFPCSEKACFLRRVLLPCVACQMCLQNVSSGLAFVHKVISAGKKSLRTWARCILYVKWISLLGQRPRAQRTGWVRRALLCWETGGPTHS